MRGKYRLLIVTFMIIYTINFFIPRSLPGNPFSHIDSNSEDTMAGLTDDEINNMKAYYGIDKPLRNQFYSTVKNNIQGNFGTSILFKKDVSFIIKKTLPWTLFIGLVGLFLGLIIAIILAVISLSGNQVDDVLYFINSILCDVPVFIIGIIILFGLAANINGWPLSGNMTPFIDYNSKLDKYIDIIKHGLMPIITLTIVSIPKFYFIARASFLNTMGRDYIKCARYRGISDRIIIFRYLIPNSLLPVISTLFFSLANIMGTSIMVENIFGYPGIGKTMIEAIRYRDYILIQGIFLVYTIIVLGANFIGENLILKYRDS